MMKTKLITLVLLGILSTHLLAFNNKREGFMLGLGAGMHNLNSELNHQSGVATSLKLGMGLNENLQVYYVREASWVKEVRQPLPFSTETTTDIIAQGITGIGATYYLKPTVNTAFISGGFGLADRVNISATYEEADIGVGVLMGAGYLYNHLLVESKAMYLALDTPITTVSVTLSYLFF